MTGNRPEADAVYYAGRAGERPLFLLSFRHRDEIAAATEMAGWHVIAARRPDAAERRFIDSGATVAIVDARGALEDGIAAIEALADPVETNGAALLALVSRNDVVALDRIHAAGATHYLASPFGAAELAQMIRFADRHAERVAGGNHAASGRAALKASESETWQWKPGSRLVRLSPALADRIGSKQSQIPVARLLGKIDRAGRRAANDAVVRLLTSGRATAFAHQYGADGARAAHHLHYDEGRGLILGRIESPDAVMLRAVDAHRDPLTGLDDGPSARRWIDRQLQAEGEEGPRCILLLLALTRFGLVNAAYGRAAGDAVLQGVARRIERTVTQTAQRSRTVAAMGGAEFAVALAAPVTIEQAEFLANRIAETVARPFVSRDNMIPLSCRVVVAAAAPEDDSAASLFRRASAALADAKNSDSGAVRLLDSNGEAEATRRDQLDIDLRHALERDQIDLVFQPQVSITSGLIIGVEALARWRHPELGEIGAEPLFATAIRSDFVAQLSHHVQRKAINVAANWPESLRPLRLSVNVTASDIARPGFASEFLDMVDRSGFPRAKLTVEVTESSLIEDLNVASSLLAELRREGLRVAIDDFGTGYSSLAYLKALPLDYLKIDKKLAEDITGSSRDRIVVRGVIDMARSLGLDVIAEGVETDEQLSLLAREGCNYYQGYLCSQPVDSETLAAMVEGWAAPPGEAGG